MRYIKFALCFIVLFSWGACTEQTYDYNDQTDIAMFALVNQQFTVWNSQPDSIINLEVCSPVAVDHDRKYIVKLIGGTDPDIDAIEHTNFEIVGSLLVTIPAGELIGTFQLKAFHASLLDDADKLVYFELEEYDEKYPVASFNTFMTLALTKACAMPIDAIAGKYALTSSVLGATKSGVAIIADPDHADGIIIRNVYAEEVALQLWPQGAGRYSVSTRGECLLGPILSDDNGKRYNAIGEATGEYNPCNGKLELDFMFYEADHPNQLYNAADTYIRE